MKALFFSICLLISTATFAQTKDTAEAPKVYVLPGQKEYFDMLTEILRQSPLVYRGKQLSFDDLLQLLQWIGNAKELAPPKTEQPKK